MEYNLALTEQEVTYLLAVLQKQPLENSYSIFNKIGEQIRAQQGQNEDSSSSAGSG